jgi:hypothetical protein
MNANERKFKILFGVYQRSFAGIINPTNWMRASCR